MHAEFRPSLSYDIQPDEGPDSWTLHCGESAVNCQDSYELVYEFEKDMTERVQLLRPELYFLHGAALASGERGLVISGASGSGKSSLAWYMIHNGYNYLSDELAPVDPKQLRVEVYPHALCLKTEPRTAPPLPESSQFTAFTIHVPAFELPARALDKPCTLNLLIFIGGTLNGEELHVQKISQAESAARLYANGLNQLSHQDEGLPVAASIARRVPSYLISGGTVEERAEAIRAMLETERVL